MRKGEKRIVKSIYILYGRNGYYSEQIGIFETLEVAKKYRESMKLRGDYMYGDYCEYFVEEEKMFEEKDTISNFDFFQKV